MTGIGTLVGPLEPGMHACQRIRQIEADPQPLGRDLGVQRLDLVGEEGNLLVALIDPAIDHHRLAAVENIARTHQQIGIDEDLELPGRVGQGGPGETLAILVGDPLLAPPHHAGEPQGRRAVSDAGRRLGEEDHAATGQVFGQIVERMAGQVKADGRQFGIETLGRGPGIGLGQARPLELGLLATTAKQAGLGALALLGGMLGHRDQGFRRGHDTGPVRIETVKGAGLGEVFKGALVDLARIDAFGEIVKIAEWPVGGAFLDDVFHGHKADIADRSEGKADRPLLDREIGLGGIHVRRPHVQLHAPHFLEEGGQLVGIGGIQRHQRRHEFDRVVGLQIAGPVGDGGIGGSV